MLIFSKQRPCPFFYFKSFAGKDMVFVAKGNDVKELF